MFRKYTKVPIKNINTSKIGTIKISIIYSSLIRIWKETRYIIDT